MLREPAALAGGASKPAPGGPLPLLDPADDVDSASFALKRRRVAVAVLIDSGDDRLCWYAYVPPSVAHARPGRPSDGLEGVPGA
eukprot:7109238-Lingulodinium_polyedra.AAC.1